MEEKIESGQQDQLAGPRPSPREPREQPPRRRIALVLFARLPVPGKAKTRLAAGVGAEPAADFYRQCAEHAFRQALSCPDVSPEVHCSSAAEAAAVAAWLRAAGCAMPVAPQLDSPDLGVRMLCALRAAAAGSSGGGGGGGGGHDGQSAAAAAAAVPALAGDAAAALAADAGAAAGLDTAARGAGRQHGTGSPPSPAAVMVAGTDVPGLSAATLSAAAAALLSGRHDAVLGPAADGGYYLIGLTAAALARPEAAALFGAGIPWSTAGVAAATRAAAAAVGLSVAPAGALPALRDIDTAQDLADWAREQEGEWQQQSQSAGLEGGPGGGAGGGPHPLLSAARWLLRGVRSGGLDGAS
ncbi:hypothetical protein Rsub_08668 [Raphidocelis subcapitata]|uniref:Glycosyltransferase n=1 Tax=Raphidocelis subcapitata TaxID=307507 RepID=A0A2V0P769_9CHLO|nr:hypothetical protein Rsub_08668 [Raphidocelis subcapitata]|eukprot:GBF95686.1 hypothetical protein Rsub_08668 [Raphidocelis subcapitata]